MAKAYSAPSLGKQKRKAIAQGDFDFLLPLQKNLWRTDEVADAISRDQQYVRALIDDGRLEAHRDSALGVRKSSLITRRSILLYLAETANYDPAYLVLRLEAVLKKLNPAALDRLIAAARQQQNRIR